MSMYDDPNRQAVGLEPIWTGAGDEPEVDPIVEQPEPKLEPEPEEEPELS